MGRIPLAEPALRGNEWHYVKECLDTNWISTSGSFVDRFEREMAQYVGAKYSVATITGTAALHLSCLIIGVKEGDEVLVPTLTFIAPVNVVRYCGAYPVFMDCDQKTLCLDVEKVASFLAQECEIRSDGYTYNRATERRVSAVIPVHIFGYPTNMDALMEVCQQYNIRVIEDASESVGSQYRGRSTGLLGDIGCFSFNGNKIVTSGGGGMIITNNELWAKRAYHLSTQAKRDPFIYDHDDIGYNYRLTNIAAALGVAQLEQLDEFIKIKRNNAEQYRTLFADLSEVSFLWEEPGVKSNFWFYTIRVGSEYKDPLMQFLLSREIQISPIWTLIHTLDIYQQYQAYRVEHAFEAWKTCIHIPCGINLTEEQINVVVKSIKDYFSHQ